MSCMHCDECGIIVDTDFDPESLYCSGFECVCEDCRSLSFEDMIETELKRVVL